MNLGSLPATPVRPAALHHALTHDGFFTIDRRVLTNADEEEWGKNAENATGRGRRSCIMPAPACLGSLAAALPPVTVKEFEWAEAVLAAREAECGASF
ncbi:hypothetical protein DQ04_00211130 [Trypanosoma grayi]|uniref:hypothetical protein n=1 Tax=Trypanosoma grayi TaxID=71804 RepID=UPI0004F4B72A|nr:hypothetical protein DQ04_00211130 [Trypanosoma grayi]KEG15030.1 hypothetical protein DQ04_00211130 [Trypanosoma grayi]